MTPPATKPPQVRLTARKPSGPSDVEGMRIVRNSCRLFMTHHQYEISKQQQTEWWKSLDSSTVRPFVFLLADRVVGYGILRKSDNRWWCSGGLVPDHRYNGLGAEIFAYLIEKCPSDELWLDVWGSNQRARRLYERLGFETVKPSDGADDIVVMKHRR